MALLSVQGVSAGYGVAANTIDEVSLGLEAGNIYCVIGPNGAGKSTLLKVLAGLLEPRAGNVLLHGAELGGLRPDQILARGMCFVPQGRSLFQEMTVRENLRMGAYLERDRGEVDRRMQLVFEVFPEVAERSAQQAGTLSGGQQQMVALGRALMVEPEVLLVDEPSLGLAPRVTEHIFATIRRFKELDMAVLMVEQNARKGLESSDWGYVLDLGEKRFEGPAETILADPRVRELYLGRQFQERGGER